MMKYPILNTLMAERSYLELLLHPLVTLWLLQLLRLYNNPRKTKLLEQAESFGCKTINGLGMTLWGGSKSFELCTGHKMPVEYVKERSF